MIRDKGVSAYGPCAGLPALAGALREKLAVENGLPGVSSAAHKLCSLTLIWVRCLVSRSSAGLGALVVREACK